MKRAFTLIEILVVIVIMGAVSAVVIPLISNHRDLKLSSCARLVVADLMYAQNSAITGERQMTYIRFDVPNQTYSLLTAFPDTVMSHPVNKSPYTQQFGAGARQLSEVSIDAAAFDAQPVLGFDELGLPYSVNLAGVATPLADGDIRLIAGGQTLTIHVEPDTGTITVD